RFFDQVGTVSWTVDAKAGTWAPEAYWGHPASERPGSDAMGFFEREGRRFGIYRYGWMEGKDRARDGALIVRFERYTAVPLAFITRGPKNEWVTLRDTDGDGKISAKDGAGEPIRDTSGQPLSRNAVEHWMYVLPSGDVRAATSQQWVFKGLDRQGAPI